jgi:hypothetical protein
MMKDKLTQRVTEKTQSTTEKNLEIKPSVKLYEFSVELRVSFYWNGRQKH